MTKMAITMVENKIESMEKPMLQTFSILAGSAACNARCPFCVSKMTPPHGVTLREPAVDWNNFRRSCEYITEHYRGNSSDGSITAMITSKGEPTLFPEQITKYLDAMKDYNFSPIELQTNGIPIAENKRRYEKHLRDWHERGLSLAAVSIVHYEPEMNRRIYLPYKKQYIDLPGLIEYMHDGERRFSVRLACVLLDGFIDSAEKLEGLMEFAHRHGVEQLTVRPVNRPEESENNAVYEWVGKNYLKEQQEAEIRDYLARRGREVKYLMHGATVYDVSGQNVCITNSLTKDDPLGGYARQLIFFPDGHLRNDWTEAAEVLI